MEKQGKNITKLELRLLKFLESKQELEKSYKIFTQNSDLLLEEIENKKNYLPNYSMKDFNLAGKQNRKQNRNTYSKKIKNKDKKNTKRYNVISSSSIISNI